MSDKPIIFSAPMVRALLAGRKTQTRRVLKLQPDSLPNGFVRLPYATGDRLWVREAHYLTDDGDEAYAVYSADAADVASHLTEMDDLKRRYPQYDWSSHLRLRPSIHMPRWASRLTLTVTDVRVQRLQEITLGDICAEGLAQGIYDFRPVQRGFDAFEALWNSIHGPKAWAANPWVCAISFTVTTQNIDQIGGKA